MKLAMTNQEKIEHLARAVEHLVDVLDDATKNMSAPGDVRDQVAMARAEVDSIRPSSA